ncbi:hypothetical protein I5506_01210 [Bacillus pumilus]|nr:hypothetical protein [Bacillus pumilus]
MVLPQLHILLKEWKSTNILLATGYEQARSVIAYMTVDKESAKRVELKLPETGV